MADITDTRTDRRSSRSPTSVDNFIGRRIRQRRIQVGSVQALSGVHIFRDTGNAQIRIGVAIGALRAIAATLL